MQQKLIMFLSVFVIIGLAGCGGSGDLTAINSTEDESSIVSSVNITELQEEILKTNLPNTASLQDTILSFDFEETQDSEYLNAPTSAPKKAVPAENVFFAILPNYESTVEYVGTSEVFMSSTVSYDYIYQILTGPVDDMESEVISGKEYSGKIQFTYYWDTGENNWYMPEKVLIGRRYYTNPRILRTKNNKLVYGTVRDDFGGAVADAKVIVTMNDYQHSLVNTNARGAFIVRAFAPYGDKVNYNISIIKNSLKSKTITVAESSLTKINLGIITMNVDNPQFTATVKGKITKLGLPVEGAVIALYDANNVLSSLPVGVTNATGDYTINFVPEGYWRYGVFINGELVNEISGGNQIVVSSSDIGGICSPYTINVGSTSPIIHGVIISGNQASTTVDVSVYASDIDKDITSYKWVVDYGNGQITGSDTSRETTWELPNAKSASIRVTVTDSAGNQALKSVDIDLQGFSIGYFSRLNALHIVDRNTFAYGEKGITGLRSITSGSENDRLYCSDGNGINLLNINTTDLTNIYSSSVVQNIVLAPDNVSIFFCDSSNTLKKYSIVSGDLESFEYSLGGQVEKFRISPNKRYLFASVDMGGTSKIVRLDLNSDTVTEFDMNGESIYDFDVHSTSRYLYITFDSKDAFLRLDHLYNQYLTINLPFTATAIDFDPASPAYYILLADKTNQCVKRIKIGTWAGEDAITINDFPVVTSIENISDITVDNAKNIYITFKSTNNHIFVYTSPSYLEKPVYKAAINIGDPTDQVGFIE